MFDIGLLSNVIYDDYAIKNNVVALLSKVTVQYTCRSINHTICLYYNIGTNEMYF